MLTSSVGPEEDQLELLLIAMEDEFLFEEPRKILQLFGVTSQQWMYSYIVPWVKIFDVHLGTSRH